MAESGIANGNAIAQVPQLVPVEKAITMVRICNTTGTHQNGSSSPNNSTPLPPDRPFPINRFNFFSIECERGILSCGCRLCIGPVCYLSQLALLTSQLVVAPERQLIAFVQLFLRFDEIPIRNDVQVLPHYLGIWLRYFSATAVRFLRLLLGPLDLILVLVNIFKCIYSQEYQ